MERRESARTNARGEVRVLQDITPPSNLVQPMQNIGLAELEEDGTSGKIKAEGLQPLKAEMSPELPLPKDKRRKRQRKVKKPDDSMYEPDAMPAKETTRSKGWRQTPLLEPNPSFQPFSTLKRNKKSGKNRADENGWGTEDATDVQDMGDFDFAGSLAKFDKHSVFNQIQAEDEIPNEDRLVAHNRLPRAKPGTSGGKNLHHTENVLDVPNGTTKAKSERWKSEDGDSDVDERTSPRGDTGSGRHSRRAESKIATNKRPPSRKGSSIIGGQPTRSLSVNCSSVLEAIHTNHTTDTHLLIELFVLSCPVRSPLRAHIGSSNA